MTTSSELQQAMDQLDTSDSEASEQPEENSGSGEQEQSDFEVPEKFEDTSRESVIKAYVDQQDKIRDQGEMISELRGRVEQLSSQLQGGEAQEEPSKPSEEEVLDQIIEDLPDDSLDMNPRELAKQILNGARQIQESQLQEFRENQLEPVQNQTMVQEAQQVIEAVASQYDDFPQYVDKIDEMLEKPRYAQPIAQADREEKARIVEDMYFRAKAMSNGQPTSSANSAEQKATGTGGRPSTRGTSSEDQFEQQAEETIRESMDLPSDRFNFND